MARIVNLPENRPKEDGLAGCLGTLLGAIVVTMPFMLVLAAFLGLLRLIARAVLG